VLKAKNISKSYSKSKVILKDITFSLDKGKAAVIIGRNGAGKSTFLSILAGFLIPDTGEVITETAKIGFVPQDDNLFLELSVQDNLSFWAKAANGTNTDLVDIFEIDKYKKQKVKNLSGGMKKSVAICCALTNNPDVLILDEPFVGLDIYYKNELIKMLVKLKEMGKSIIYTSHNIDEMLGLAGELYTLSDGELKLIGDAEHMADKPDELLKLLGRWL